MMMMMTFTYSDFFVTSSDAVGLILDVGVHELLLGVVDALADVLVILSLRARGGRGALLGVSGLVMGSTTHHLGNSSLLDEIHFARNVVLY